MLDSLGLRQVARKAISQHMPVRVGRGYRLKYSQIIKPQICGQPARRPLGVDVQGGVGRVQGNIRAQKQAQHFMVCVKFCRQ